MSYECITASRAKAVIKRRPIAAKERTSQAKPGFRDDGSAKVLNGLLASRSNGSTGKTEPNVVRDLFAEAQDIDRIRVGRALHDSTGQLLLSLSLSFARFRQTPHDSGLDAMLDEMGDTIRQIDREIRTFAFLEFPAELNAGLVPAVETFSRGFAKRTGLQLHFDCHRMGGGVTDQRTALALLRICQEALVNVYRHAHASVVHVNLVRSPAGLELTVEDDGCGMPPSQSFDRDHGVGLIGMRDRAERLGGELFIERMKKGTKIVAIVPSAPTAA